MAESNVKSPALASASTGHCESSALPAVRLVLLLLFFLVFVGGLLSFHLLVFGLGGLHGLAAFFGTLGAQFGTLLALLVQRLLAAEQLDEGCVATISLAET